jgi:hypothetical protein
MLLESFAPHTSLKGITRSWDFVILDPSAVYTKDAHVFVAIMRTAITITKIMVSCDAVPGAEVQGDLKFADAFIGLANPELVNDFDTTNGVRVDATIAQGNVGAGKALYLEFDAPPDVGITQLHFHIEFHED